MVYTGKRYIDVFMANKPPKGNQGLWYNIPFWYLQMYVCLCVRMYVNVSIYVCACVCVCINVHMYVCMFTSKIPPGIHKYTYVYVNMYVCTCVCVYSANFHGVHIVYYVLQVVIGVEVTAITREWRRHMCTWFYNGYLLYTCVLIYNGSVMIMICNAWSELFPLICYNNIVYIIIFWIMIFLNS